MLRWSATSIKSYSVDGWGNPGWSLTGYPWPEPGWGTLIVQSGCLDRFTETRLCRETDRLYLVVYCDSVSLDRKTTSKVR